MKYGLRLLAFVLFAATALPLGANELIGSISLNANRTFHRGACPTSITFHGSIDIDVPPSGMVFNYSWTRSDGATTQPQVIHMPAGSHNRHYPISTTWTLGAPGQHYDIWEELHVNTGNTHRVQRSQTVSVDCR
jgi:hypothetical protein